MGTPLLLGAGTGSLFSYDAVTTAWAAAVVSNGGSVSATSKGYVDTFVKALRSYSLLSTIDCLWVYANYDGSSQQALTEVTAGTGSNILSTLPVAPTLTTAQGYSGNGTSQYISTGYNLSTNKVNVSQDSLTIGAYVRSAGNTTGCILGSVATHVTNMQNNVNANQVRVNINTSAGASTFTQTGIGGVTGPITGCRASGPATTYYQRGSAVGSTDSTTASTGLPNGIVFALAQNVGEPVSFCSTEIAILVFASAWDATQNANFATASNAYMTSLGTNVY